MKKDKINRLREIVLTKDITNLSKNTRLFGGADVSIVSKLPDLKEDFYGNPQYVVTKFSKELSWLIFQLKEIFTDELDYLNKYPFYGRLAEKANESIKLKGDNLNTIMTDVLEEAEKMSKEAE